MYCGTYFLRNRPALELLRRTTDQEAPQTTIRIAVLGCSIGVEVYSILWTLRRHRPDLQYTVEALDISADAVRIGERGVYDAEALEVAGWPVFQGLSDAERADLFDNDGDANRISEWLRTGITWRVGDASDPGLAALLGPQDLVIANNFLCHLPAPAAEACLRNLAQLARPGGHILVTGVDLDVRTKVANDLGWEPINDLLEEVHEGDPFVRADWPARWWGLEPLDKTRSDWETRYNAIFRIPDSEVR